MLNFFPKASQALLAACIGNHLVKRFCSTATRDLLCETSTSCCHGHSPPSVSPSPLISNRHPFASPALPGFIALRGASDFRPLPPSSSLLTLVRGYAAPSTPTTGSPWLPRTLYVKLDAASDPGLAPCARLGCPRSYCLRVIRNPRPTPTPDFSGLNPFTVSFTCYQCTSPPFAPTHQSRSHQLTCKAPYQARG